MSTQIQRIEAHLKRGESLTPLQALALYGTFRLAHHVWVIKERWDAAGSKSTIHTRLCTDPNGHKYAEYYMGPVVAQSDQPAEALTASEELDLAEVA